MDAGSSGSTMKWPAGFEPDNSSVYARNEIAIDAPPERVWRWLIRAAKWPEWYSNSANVRFLRGNPPDLAPDYEFSWKTFGATVTSRVITFVLSRIIPEAIRTRASHSIGATYQYLRSTSRFTLSRSC